MTNDRKDRFLIASIIIKYQIFNIFADSNEVKRIIKMKSENEKSENEK